MKGIYYHTTPKSNNAKTGRIAVTTTADSACPNSCPLKGDGCYASSGFHLALHWRKVTSGERGKTHAEHCADLRALPAGRMLRLNQAGDLPGDGETLYPGATAQILASATDGGRIAWTYTHYQDAKSLSVLDAIRRESPETATVNLSGNGLAHADKLSEQNPALPVVTITASADKVQRTPAGRRVVLCPAQSTEGVTCETCGNGRPLCARSDRDYIVGFHVHGKHAKAAANVAAHNG